MRLAFYFIAVFMSLGASIFVVYWGLALSQYNQRDIVTLQTPETPARIKSNVHGGLEFNHQNLSVNDIGDRKTSNLLADRVVLAPAIARLAPEDLAPVDLEKIALQTLQETTKNKDENAILSQNTTKTVALAPVDLENTLASKTELEKAIANDIQKAIDTVIFSENLPQAIRPPNRPANLSKLGAKQSSNIKYFANLGTYSNRKTALAKWQVFKHTNTQMLNNKWVKISDSKNNNEIKTSVYITGFRNIQEVNNFCIELISKNQNCEVKKGL